MGYIYKIQNMINGKKYIGQTTASLNRRFNQHKNNRNKPYFSNVALYQAFNKYGIENFSFEEVEEVANSKLDEREIYWIDYYDSYYNGYNSTLGGQNGKKYDWDINLIVELYNEYRSARKVAKELNCDHSTIDHILNEAGIKRYTPEDWNSHRTIIEKGKEQHFFQNTTEAAQWFLDNNYTKTKRLDVIKRQISTAAHKNRTYLGFKISRL